MRDISHIQAALEDRRAEYRELLHRAHHGAPFHGDRLRRSRLLCECVQLSADLRAARNHPRTASI